MRENLLKKQPTWGLRRAQGTGQKSVTPATLTKVILVLLTMFLLPSAAWGQDITVTTTFTGWDSTKGILYSESNPNKWTPDPIDGTWGTSADPSGLKYTMQSSYDIFSLKSDFTLEGSLENGNKIAEIEIGQDNINTSGTISIYQGNNTEPIGASGLTTLENGVVTISAQKATSFSGDKLIVKFNGVTSEGSPFVIKAIRLYNLTPTSYNLTVASIPVKSTNASNITGDGIIEGNVYFDPEENTLTLQGAKINGSIVYSGTKELKMNLIGSEITSVQAAISLNNDNNRQSLVINLEGENFITTTGQYEVLLGAKMSSTLEECCSVEFTSSTETSSLTLQGGGTGVINSFLNVSYNGLGPTYITPETATSLTEATIVQISVVNFNLTVATVPVTSFNRKDILNNGKVSFTPAEGDDFATLTLNNATLNGGIIWNNGSNALIVKLDGMNYIETSTNDPAFKATASCDLYIKKNNPDNDATVKFSGSIVDFNSQPDNGFKQIFDAITPCSYYTTKTVYGISIGGTDLHDISGENGYLNTSTGAITGMDHISFALATVSPDAQTPGTPATLTLTGVEFTGCIEWNNSEALTIALSGSNSISNTSGAAIIGNSNNPSLTFVKASDAESCKLVLIGNDGEISGFGDGPFIANNSGLYYIEGDNSTTITSTLLSGGSGTSTEDPLLIKTSDDLKDFAICVNNGIITNQIIKLDQDITCPNNFEMDQIGSSVNFIGTFDGGGNTISNLTLSTNALFRMMGSGGTVKDLILDNLKINSDGSYTAAIADHLHEGNTISGCIVKNSEIKCINTTQYPYIGGIVGRLYGGTVSGCTVENTTITGETTDGQVPYAYVGGIASEVDNGGKIEGCFVKGNTVITASRTDVGSVIYAGAITPSAPSAEALTNNYYEYSVIVKTKGPDDSDYQIKNKYTHRGTNADTDPDDAVMYTKDVIIIPTTNNGGYVSIDYDNYYKATSDDTNNTTTYSVAPGEEVKIYVESAVIAGSYTLNSETKTITLVKGEGEDGSLSYYTFTMPDADVTFTVQAAAEVWMYENQIYATYYNASEDVAVPMGMTAYVVTGISADGTKVTVTPVSYIKAGEAVLIEKDKTTEFSETTDFSKITNMMRYYDPNNPVTPTTPYVLYDNKFVKVTAGTSIGYDDENPDYKRGACYLELGGTTNAGTRGFYNIGDGEGTTAIREVISEGVNSEKLADGEWFDLQGRRLNAKPNKSGLYILNGKKVVIK